MRTTLPLVVIALFTVIIITTLFEAWPWLIIAISICYATFRSVHSYLNYEKLPTQAAYPISCLVFCWMLYFGPHWYWNNSKLASAEKKCAELRLLWQTNQHKKAIAVLDNLAENRQEWEDSDDSLDSPEL